MRLNPLIFFSGAAATVIVTGATTFALGFPVGGVIVAGLLGLLAGIRASQSVKPGSLEDIDIGDSDLATIRYRKSRDWRGRETDNQVARGPLGSLSRIVLVSGSIAWRRARTATITLLGFAAVAILLPALLGAGGAAGRNAFFVFLACTVCVATLDLRANSGAAASADRGEEDIEHT